MIILLGPDNSGKTTLAQHLLNRSAGTGNAQHPYKAVAATGYKEYIELLRGVKSNPLDVGTYRPGLALATDGKVLADRFFYCELPYATLFRKEQRTKFTLKQWHNMHLSTIAFNPVVVLATHQAESPHDDPVPEELFKPILRSYKYWLTIHGIEWVDYDFTRDTEEFEEELLLHAYYQGIRVQWWTDMARSGLAGVGNTTNPKVLVMAQDLGPSNIHRIAFEQGPSGYYLSDLIDAAEIPLNSFYLTNWLKTKDMEQNRGLLRTELEALTAANQGLHVILLGRDAEGSIPIIKSYCAPEKIHTIRHPGWVVNHSYTIKEKLSRQESYLEEWKALWTRILTPGS